MLSKKRKQDLCAKISNEGGFDYTFMNYSNFPEIKDKTFRKLVQEYKDALNRLSSYLSYDEFEG